VRRRGLLPRAGVWLFGLAGWLLTIAPGLQGQELAQDRYWPQAPLTIRQGKFCDAQGRQVILNGINLVDKDPSDGFNLAGGPGLFGQLRAWGFNCVRLGIVWAGVEPEPGKFDQAYLAKVDQCVRLASQQGLFVILEMHQDLYGMTFGNGAPVWATLDESKEHDKGTIWSDAYYLSSAVQTAFTNFWNNKPAPDGKGLQDHYVAMWQHVAGRYAKEPRVLGYDIMNDPYMGQDAQTILPLFLEQYILLVVAQSGGTPPDPKELQSSFGDLYARAEALKVLDPAASYSKLVDAVEEVHKTFETGPLQAMYQRVAEGIRQVDPKHILFLEHGYFANLGVRSGLRPTTLPDGQPDPMVAYAPHVFDLLTDTPGIVNLPKERAQLLASRIQEVGQQTGMPILVGGWGSFHDTDPLLVDSANRYLEQFEEFRMGSSYSDYSSDMSGRSFFRDAIVRPYPVCIAGSLEKYALNRDSNQLEITWQETDCGGYPTAIFLPDRKLLKKAQVTLEPKARRVSLWYQPDADGGFLLVYPDPGSLTRQLTVPLEIKELAEIMAQEPAAPQEPVPPAPAATPEPVTPPEATQPAPVQ
jgi:endoglycosylceramidase